MKQVTWTQLSESERLTCLKRPPMPEGETLGDGVRAILEDVRAKGDTAVKNFTQKFDRVELDTLQVNQETGELDPASCQAIDTAYRNIRAFHEQQGFAAFSLETMPGIACRRVVRPIERVGIYVPGGTAPLISTTLMLGIPAQLAGCQQVTMCTPCDKNGKVNSYILYAAKLCGIESIYRIGGAQAIAAMAYGTQTITKSDKIFGPGNAYVTEAKIQVARDAGGAAIDIPAGPSEVCVIADETTNPVFAAADLLSQAEHDVLSQVLLISTAQSKIDEIKNELEKQLADLPRKDIAAKALENSTCIVAQDMGEALEISNLYAPEHLILCFEGAKPYIEQITNAGSVFLGPWTPESAGDYASGTNHVLPTYGYARMYSGLGVEAFQKTITVQSATPEGLRELGPAVETLARLEKLEAHARAISLRLANIK